MSLLPPGPHGGDSHRLAATLGVAPDQILDLSASLNPFAPDCRDILAKALDDIDRYPDDTAATTALAEAIGVDANRVVLTNGGAEAIALVAQMHRRGWADECEFGLYRRHIAELDPTGPRWQSDPHNPTGALAPADRRARIRDEAFYLLATGSWTRGDAGATVVGSVTKAWALPGLRVGYVIAADDAEARSIRARRPRWSVNGLVASALPGLLDRAEPERWRDGIAELRAELVALLARFGHHAVASDANYVWLPDAADLRERLLPHGVVVRDGTSFGAPDAVRIAVPSADDLVRLDHALTQALNSPSSESRRS